MSSFSYKMRSIVLLLVVFALGNCGKLRKWEYSGDIERYIEKYGYPVSSHTVQTEDGYILDLFRISGEGRQSENRRNIQKYRDSSDSDVQNEKPAILLIHGMYSNSEDFVMGGPTEGLAFILADAGYDVYLGNTRGSTYGLRHTTLNPKTDAAFWKFCFHEKGVKDLPAIIDKVLSISGQQKIFYIGHNTGTTSFYVMMSELPDYNEKINRQISLGPVSFMSNADDQIVKDIATHLTSQSWIMKNVGVNNFAPSSTLMENAKAICINDKYDEDTCNNIYFLMFGSNTQNFNKTTIDQVVQRVPSSGSVKEVMHLSYLMSNDRFQTFSDDGQVKDYDLSKVTVPVAVLYTPEDPISHVTDVQKLISALPNVSKSVNFEDLKNNLDLLYSENIDNVYNVILKLLREDPQKTTSKM